MVLNSLSVVVDKTDRDLNYLRILVSRDRDSFGQPRDIPEHANCPVLQVLTAGIVSNTSTEQLSSCFESY